MKTTIEFNFEHGGVAVQPLSGVYRITAEWPTMLKEPMVFQGEITYDQMKHIEEMCGGNLKLIEKEVIAHLMKDALWILQAFMFKTIQK